MQICRRTSIQKPKCTGKDSFLLCWEASFSFPITSRDRIHPHLRTCHRYLCETHVLHTECRHIQEMYGICLIDGSRMRICSTLSEYLTHQRNIPPLQESIQILHHDHRDHRDWCLRSMDGIKKASIIDLHYPLAVFDVEALQGLLFWVPSIAA